MILVTTTRAWTQRFHSSHSVDKDRSALMERTLKQQKHETENSSPAEYVLPLV